jgi:hypothetical protein
MCQFESRNNLDYEIDMAQPGKLSNSASDRHSELDARDFSGPSDCISNESLLHDSQSSIEPPNNVQSAVARPSIPSDLTAENGNISEDSASGDVQRQPSDAPVKEKLVSQPPANGSTEPTSNSSQLQLTAYHRKST